MNGFGKHGFQGCHSAPALRARGLAWAVCLLLVMPALPGCPDSGSNDNDNGAGNDNSASTNDNIGENENANENTNENANHNDNENDNTNDSTGDLIIMEDTTVESLTVGAGDTLTIANNAILTVSGDTMIQGLVTATDSRVTIMAQGAVTIDGALESILSNGNDPADDVPFDEQTAGIYIVITDGEVMIDENATFETSGNVVVTDKPEVLNQTPQDFFDEVEDVSEDDMTTFVPLPPDNEAFDEGANAMGSAAPRSTSGPMLPPVTIRGTWPPAGAVPPRGDRPVVIFRFDGLRNMILQNLTINSPAAPSRPDADQSMDPGDNADGADGKNGMRLNIWNSGPINIQGTVTFNLANGGDGGNATAVCGSATGGDGGKSGNFRMTSGQSIDFTNGNVLINPGISGFGGSATVDKGAAAADGCPGGTGAKSTATGGNGADNRKRLYVRGTVNGLANLTIGPVFAGDGGDATAEACDGGDGLVCCDGGNGGEATATGGAGGEASLNLSGLPVADSGTIGGNGGMADATGGDGGDGGDCKFGDAGDAANGGDAKATSGAGGAATNAGAGGATGGDSPDAVATGGDSGDGGDSGFGAAGSGGMGGIATGTVGTPGTGATASGSAGESDTTTGGDGVDGGALPTQIYCIPLNAVSSVDNFITPNMQQLVLLADDNTTEIGTIDLEFVEGGLAYLTNDNPVAHIGVQGGQVDIELETLNLQAVEPLGPVGGVRIAPLYGAGIDAENPLLIQGLDANGEVVSEETFVSIPDNQANPATPETIDSFFDVFVEAEITTIRIEVPPTAFVTFISFYLLDP